MREREQPRLSRDSLATQVFQTQETLHKLEMPWKGTSSLLSSLPITNSGSSWTPARVMKGTESSRLSEHFGWDLFKLHLLTRHYGVSMTTGVCFSVLHVEGLYLTVSPCRENLIMCYFLPTCLNGLYHESVPSFHEICTERNAQGQSPIS